MKPMSVAVACFLAVVLLALVLPAAPGCGENSADDKQGASGQGIPALAIDEEARTVTVRAVVADQKREGQAPGAIDYVLVSKGSKSANTIFIADEPAEKIRQALLKIGLKPGQVADRNEPSKGSLVRISARYELKGKTSRRSVDELVIYYPTRKALRPKPWVFTGSVETTDEKSGEKVLQATTTQHVIGLYDSKADPSPLVMNPRKEATKRNVYRADLKRLPPAGTPVRIVFKRIIARDDKAPRRVHLFISGRVQGVGFRNFTRRTAQTLGLTGWVKNLKDGRVEAIVEGPSGQVDQLLMKVRRGPRRARVTRVAIEEEQPSGEFSKFEVRR